MLFLYLHVKAVLAAGADYGVLTLLLRQAQIVFTGRTFSVYVGLSVAHFAFLQVVYFLYLFANADKFLIFLLSFVNIS